MEVVRRGRSRRTLWSGFDVLEDGARVEGEVDARGSNGEDRRIGGRGQRAVVVEQGRKPMIHGVVGVEKAEFSVGSAQEVPTRELGETVDVLAGLRVNVVGHKGRRPVHVME